MESGDSAGKRAVKLTELVGKESRILALIEGLIPILRNAPAPEQAEDE